jgi:hypothetical protein
MPFMTLSDLSAPIRPEPPDNPEPFRTEIQFDDHAPLRIEGAGAVPARVVAIVPEGDR